MEQILIDQIVANVLIRRDLTTIQAQQAEIILRRLIKKLLCCADGELMAVLRALDEALDELE